MKMITLMTVVAISVASSLTASAGLPEGTFKGKSSIVSHNWYYNNDIMALFIKKDANVATRYHAILAEYDRIPYTNITARLAITKWVPRLYVFQLDQTGVGSLTYDVSPLAVGSGGDIEAKAEKVGSLTLATDGNMNGALFQRFVKDSTTQVEESIQMKGFVRSTWEDYVEGNYLGTSKNTGKDYFSKRVNTNLAPKQMLTNDGAANFFFQEKKDGVDIEGQFKITESKTVPGMYVFKSKNCDLTEAKGTDKVLNKIAVFIDIVNWKKFGFTTEELLLINPDNAKDIGFFYEKH